MALRPFVALVSVAVAAACGTTDDSVAPVDPAIEAGADGERDGGPMDEAATADAAVDAGIAREYRPGAYATWDLVSNGELCVAAGNAGASTTPCPGSASRFVAKNALGLYQNYGLVGVLLARDWNDLDSSTSATGPIAWDVAGLASFIQAIDDVHNMGLGVVIEVEASQDRAPSYLKSKCGAGVVCVQLTETNAVLATCGQTGLLPVHWDTGFRAAKKRLFEQLAVELGPRLDFIAAISLPVANYRFSEMWVPHATLTANVACNNGTVVPAGYSDIQRWLDAGYACKFDAQTNACLTGDAGAMSRDVDANGVSTNMKSAALEVMDTIAAVFPKQFLKLHMQPTDARLDGAKTNLATSIGDHGFGTYGDRFRIQIDSMRVNQPSSSTNVPPGNSTTVRGVSDKDLVAYEWNYFNLHSGGFGMQMVAAVANGNIDNCRANTFIKVAGATCYEKSGTANDYLGLSATGQSQAAAVFDALMRNTFSYGAINASGTPAATIADTAAIDAAGEFVFKPGGIRFLETWRADAVVPAWYARYYCATVQMGGVTLGQSIRAQMPLPAAPSCAPY